jgi:hypothetical protein
MQLNPTLVTIIGLFVFGIGWAVKQFKWDLNGRPMFWFVVAVSLVGGIVQVVVSAQTTPFPPLPSDPAQIVFAWLPTVIGWVAASSAAVFAASQAIYGLIKKGLWPNAPVAE